jgi:hypothetical protein
MKKVIFAAVLAFAIRCGCESFGATSGFEKVGDHCYYLQLKERKNVAAVVTEDGILVVDPPQEPDLSVAVDALRRISSKPVRWVVLTDPRFSRAAGTRFFAEQGSLLLASTQLRALSTTQPEETPSFPWLTFERQMHLFPSNLEIRIMAIQHKASTGGDVVAYVPAEKVLFVGDLYEAACYPDIDDASQGSALGWIDGLKQVIDSVPVLKSAIPPKPEPKPKQERTLEEGILVVSARGEASNLQNMKDLLEACQKLRRDISKAIRMGQSCESFLASPGADPYRGYANLAPFAAQLFEDLAAAAGPNK